MNDKEIVDYIFDKWSEEVTFKTKDGTTYRESISDLADMYISLHNQEVQQ